MNKEPSKVRNKRDFCVKPGIWLYVMCAIFIVASYVGLEDIIADEYRFHVLPFLLICGVTGFYLGQSLFLCDSCLRGVSELRSGTDL